MKKLLVLILGGVLLIGMGCTGAKKTAQQSVVTESAEPEAKPAASASMTLLQNASYALGVNYANKLKEDSIPIIPARMDKAMTDVYTKAQPEIDQTKVQDLLRAYFIDTIANPDLEPFSYALGYSIAKNLNQLGFDKLDLAEFRQGRDDFDGQKNLRIAVSDIDSIIVSYQKEIQTKTAAERKQKADKAKTEGEAFLAENAKKEGVKTTASGLQYKVLRKGTGKSPKATDKVTVHYVGKFLDGTVFDSSVERGAPSSFALNQVISGWTEGLQLMNEGGKYRLFIPSDLAYGASGLQSIPGNSVLIFDVELIAVD